MTEGPADETILTNDAVTWDGIDIGDGDPVVVARFEDGRCVVTYYAGTGFDDMEDVAEWIERTANPTDGDTFDVFVPAGQVDFEEQRVIE